MDTLKNSEELLKKACDFQAISIKARLETKELFREKETNELNVFRITMDGLISRLSEIMINKIEKVDKKISYQIGIITSFIRSYFIINNLIMTGDLIEASILSRKQFESLSRLFEIDSKPLEKLLKKTPNVINVFKTAGKRLYPELSEIAHFGTPRVSHLLGIQNSKDGRYWPSITPVFLEESYTTYRSHAFISIYFSFWLIDFLEKNYNSYNAKIDKETFYTLLKLAEEEKIIVIID